MTIERVCVYCASSDKAPERFFEEARALGSDLAKNSMTMVFGGGKLGLMGAVATATLDAGGQVIGIIPDFLQGVEPGHEGVQDLRVVPDMHIRKRIMMDEAHAFVALPGGCGTFDELMEVITWKRLGRHTKPIVVVNIDGFYDPFVELMQRSIDNRCMAPIHGDMWSVVDSAAEVIPALNGAKDWDEDALMFANV